MAQGFDFSALDHHDFFHLKYGRGAVIVAIEKNADGSSAKETMNSGRHVARTFNQRPHGDLRSSPTFDRVTSIEEGNGVVRIVLEFVHHNRNAPTSYPPIKGTIERVIPAGQVTLEIVRGNETEQPT